MNAVLRRAQAKRRDSCGLLDGRCCSRRPAATAGAPPMAPRPSPASPRRCSSGAPLDLTLKDDDPDADRSAGRRAGRWPTPCASSSATGRSSSCPAMPRAAGGCRTPPRPSRRGCSSCRRARACSISAPRPGGKTAQLIKAGYAVTALDRDAERLERLQRNLDRLGLCRRDRHRRCRDLRARRAVRWRAARCAVLGDRHLPAASRSGLAPRPTADIAGRVALQRAMLANAAATASSRAAC